MFTNFLKNNQPLKMINSALAEMPVPINIPWVWNLGAMLGSCLILQLTTGSLLAMYYSDSAPLAFNSMVLICQEINEGWLMRNLHASGASLFFTLIYLHIARGLYFTSSTLLDTWTIGVSILLLTMATAFLGYVLPWGQMSLWGATVITNLLSSVPYAGPSLVTWLWGGSSVSTPTLSRFFALHFILPFMLLALVIIHLVYLHQTGSSNPLGVKKLQLISFHPLSSTKDLLGVSFLLVTLLALALALPYYLMDPENFIHSNPLNSPLHIQPEWYYLFAYAILRSIPNKLGGVVALILSVLILYSLPFTLLKKMSSLQFYPANKVALFSFFAIMLLLTWIGARSVETPFILTGQILTISYFSFFIFEPLLTRRWEQIMNGA